MASVVTRAQDIIRCSLCECGAYYHCLKCRTILCDDCTSTHLSDKSKNHEIVGYTSQKRNFAFDYECAAHNRNNCEIYCKDCKKPICTKCVTGEHRKHNFADLEDAVDEKKAEILNEIQEVEATILKDIQDNKIGLNNDEYEAAIEAVFAQEDLICETVRNYGSKLREQIMKHRKENEEKANKNAFEEKEILRIIQISESMLKSDDTKAILEFKGLKCQLSVPSQSVDRSIPFLEDGLVNMDIVSSMFGALMFSDDVEDKVRFDVK